MGQPESPRRIYERRLAQRRAVADRLLKLDEWSSNGRLVAFSTAIAVCAGALGFQWFAATWITAPGVGFLALVLWHDTVIRRRERAVRAERYYQAALDRLSNRWVGKGVQGNDFAQADHPYAADLDIFGPGSLFELLCTARTRSGEEVLAQWLRSPARLPEIKARHQAVRELQPKLDLRERLAVAGADVRAAVHPEALASWGAAPAKMPGLWVGALLAALAVTAVVTLVAWPVWRIGPFPFLATLIVELIVGRWLKEGIQATTAGVEQPRAELDVLVQLLVDLEREPMTCDLLVRLQAAIAADKTLASTCVARLRRLTDLLDAPRNQLFAPIGFVLMWTPLCALAIERWRLRYGPAVGRWLRAVGELEALSALAGYAFEHPEDPFPELTPKGPLFDGKAVGHPLMPEEACVTNDVSLDNQRQLLLVSGSNMSGKSTLLRTVGINGVLGLAGAPVRASRLLLSPLAVGATLRIQDSLHSGTSRFYAEIKRLRQLMDLAGDEPPLLFLLDELLHGTNSHDRRLGAEGILKGLTEVGAIGLATTHDLALAATVDALGSRAANVHFEDSLQQGQLTFDYSLRPGVVNKSNALELMRAVGLRV